MARASVDQTGQLLARQSCWPLSPVGAVGPPVLPRLLLAADAHLSEQPWSSERKPQGEVERSVCVETTGLILLLSQTIPFNKLYVSVVRKTRIYFDSTLRLAGSSCYVCRYRQDVKSAIVWKGSIFYGNGLKVGFPIR